MVFCQHWAILLTERGEREREGILGIGAYIGDSYGRNAQSQWNETNCLDNK